MAHLTVIIKNSKSQTICLHKALNSCLLYNIAGNKNPAAFVYSAAGAKSLLIRIQNVASQRTKITVTSCSQMVSIVGILMKKNEIFKGLVNLKSIYSVLKCSFQVLVKSLSISIYCHYLLMHFWAKSYFLLHCIHMMALFTKCFLNMKIKHNKFLTLHIYFVANTFLLKQPFAGLILTYKWPFLHCCDCIHAQIKDLSITACRM